MEPIMIQCWRSTNDGSSHLVPLLVQGVHGGCGTLEELLVKFLKLLLEYFISKSAEGVDEASVLLKNLFLLTQLIFRLFLCLLNR